MESVNAALKKVADFTDALSSEQAVTASSLKPVLQLITEDLLLPAEEDTQLTCRLKEKMSGVLMDKYSASSTQKILAKTAFVDPRYKDIDISDEVKDEQMRAMTEMEREKTQRICLRKKRNTTPIPKRIRVDTEMSRYLQEEALDPHADPLVWWRDNNARFPVACKGSAQIPDNLRYKHSIGTCLQCSRKCRDIFQGIP
ncbi:Zinc finger BED domaincontaining protein 1like [Caligus rogercresseyi]|uniref:Zinc finger BED domaincontaining protein 1like n=1 Tax=Caligus rogercresseyi TaxID=217165 RepID=A0A7T8HM66_CALRO|nr:Zinc finger BED domaincontaining protein 1like [Caligus rogercresseyi]